MLKVTGIYKKYGELEVLKGVDIEVQTGEVVSIVGSSGAGKSTLLHIAGTLDAPDAGHIEIRGTKIEYQPSIKIIAAPWWKRALNLLLDIICISIISYSLILTIPFLQLIFVPKANWQLYVYNFTLILLYFTLFEWLTGMTPAKYLTKSKVIIKDKGTSPSLINCFIRSIARFIPFEFLSFFSKRPISWHDSLSGTMVIDNTIPYQKKLIKILSPKELSYFRNKHIGFIFQFHHLLPEFTALENVCIPGWIAKRKKKEVEARAKELLDLLGLKDKIDNKPNQLSGGEQQRVAVARALINNPDIVFADEPTGNLDSTHARELHQLFFDLRSQLKQTFLIVTHNEELADLSDRKLVMKDGRIIDNG